MKSKEQKWRGARGRWAVGLIMAAARVCAMDYHVAADGNDANAGTAEQPFQTLQKASAVLEPGDTCRVGRGVYRETLRPLRSGRFEKPIRYLAVTGETVTVTGADERTESPALPLPEIRTRKWGVDLEGLSLIEVSGFTIQAGGINLAGANYCRLENCQVGSVDGAVTNPPGIKASVTPGEEGAIRIGGRENEVVRCSVVGCEGAGIVFLPGSVNNRVLGVLVRAAGGYGVVVGGTAQTVRHSTILDCSEGAVLCSNLYNGRILNNDLQRTGRNGVRRPMVRITGDGKGTILAYNRIHENEADAGDGVLMDGPAENYLLHHNVIWGQPGSAIRLRGKVQYCLIFNNTCARNGTGLEQEDAISAGVAKGMRFFNNLFAGPVWPATEGKPAEGVIWENNYVGTIPGFMDEAACQFGLKADSPCIDAGRDEPELTDAHNGRHPDAGAYEFGQDFPVSGRDGFEEKLISHSMAH